MHKEGHEKPSSVITIAEIPATKKVYPYRLDRLYLYQNIFQISDYSIRIFIHYWTYFAKCRKRCTLGGNMDFCLEVLSSDS